MIKQIKVAVISVLSIGMALPAFSQNFRNGQVPEGYVSVQSSFSIVVPLDDPANYEKQQAMAVKSFYQLVASNCPMLLETIADACQITGMNSNSNMNTRDQRGTQLMVQGQVTMAVKLKSSIGSPKSPQ
ncbi:hypothetical protein [Phyllobacterium zundukense]|uniref:UrcA family protein n=1 Tax=Phyllobacterium zundukense TaxID=1867719 RepID=A0A2N9VW03_9HYPH|nr:hypothetical protein [Phyllobacterium zundukense]ATU91403.1 hypothetical protein BLM14_06980 [Phyllobacterium zundukense]PIO43671.1 hypothetical protein B5P45_17365 [Phyllobacterium zundukense]